MRAPPGWLCACVGTGKKKERFKRNSRWCFRLPPTIVQLPPKNTKYIFLVIPPMGAHPTSTKATHFAKDHFTSDFLPFCYMKERARSVDPTARCRPVVGYLCHPAGLRTDTLKSRVGSGGQQYIYISY